ncbi:MAG: VWA domain-containing protein [Planctomycetota bacterium]
MQAAGDTVHTPLQNLFVLIVDEGPVRRHYTLRLTGSDRLRIGSGEECDIRIRDGGLAPVQVTIEGGRDRLLLFHEGGAVPTRVDGHQVTIAHLAGGESLTLGTLTLRVARLSSAAAWRRGRSDAERTVVVHTQYAEGRSEVLRNSLRRAPWFLLSGLLHLLLLLLVSRVEMTRPSRVLSGLVTSVEVASPADLDRMDPPEVAPLPTELEDEEALLPTPEPPSESPVSSLERELAQDSSPVAGTGLAARAGADLGAALGLPGGLSGDFRRLVGELRSRGLDLAIVFDSTSSMQDFLSEVSRDIAEMINVIAAIVPDFRIALVTYKGTPDLGPVLLSQDFSADRYAIIGFLDEIDSRGGAMDARSAMAQGLQHTSRNLAWRNEAEKVIVLIGDAPPFIEERPLAMAAAQHFRGRLSAIYKASGGVTELEHRDETVAMLRDLARGRGDFDFYDGEGPVVRRLVYAALGSSYAKSIDRVFTARMQRWQEHLVGAKIRTGDYDWLFSQLARRHVHPAVVDALVGLAGPYVTERCYFLLESLEDDMLWLAPRLVYILRRITGQTRLIEYDAAAPRWLRLAQLDVIRKAAGVSPRGGKAPPDPQKE